MWQFDFLGLPIELRTRIYREVAAPLGCVPPQAAAAEDWNFDEDKPRRLALRQVCRAVRDEFDAFEPAALRVITQRALHACSRDPRQRRAMPAGPQRALHLGPLPQDGMAAMHQALSKEGPRIRGNVSYSLPQDPTLDDSEGRYRERSIFVGPTSSLPLSGKKNLFHRKERSELMLSALSVTNKASSFTVHVPHKNVHVDIAKASFNRIESSRREPYELVVMRSHDLSLNGNDQQKLWPHVDPQFFEQLNVCPQLFRLDLENIVLNDQERKRLWELFDTLTNITEARFCFASQDDRDEKQDSTRALWRPAGLIPQLRRLSITLDDNWQSDEVYIPHTLLGMATLVGAATQLEHLSLLQRSPWQDACPSVPAGHVTPLYDTACALPSLRELVLGAFFQPKEGSKAFSAALSAPRNGPLSLQLQPSGWSEMCVLEATAALQHSHQRLDALFLDGQGSFRLFSDEDEAPNSLDTHFTEWPLENIKLAAPLPSNPVGPAAYTKAQQVHNLQRLACYESWLSTGVVTRIGPANDASILQSPHEPSNHRWQTLQKEFPGRLLGGAAALAAARPKW